jgi:SAM-dependent methyltransferase
MPTYEPFDWYENARYYDIVFDMGTEQEADFLEAAFREHGESSGRRVLEPACGSGRLVVAMAERGWLVTGFDASPGMLRFARERMEQAGLDATLFEGRMESFSVDGPFDLAHCLVSTFRYLLTERDARSHLECVARALAPGGIYVLGLHLSDYDDTHRRRERWVAARGGTEVVCNIQSWPPERATRTERLRSRMVVHERGRERRFETNWTFRTYDVRQLRRLLKSVPALEHLATYDFRHDITTVATLDGSQLDVVLVLQKR